MAMRERDSMDMLGALYSLPEQCARAWELGRAAALPRVYRVDDVMVTGLGGSAIGGDLLRTYAAAVASVPVVVNRDYVLPRHVGSHTLVFAVSYSGNTEETLSAYREAREKGAPVVAITTGGRLGALAEEDGVPLIVVPAGLAPRAATGYLFLPMLAVMSGLGLIAPVEEEVAEMVAVLTELRSRLEPGVPAAENPAKTLAWELLGNVPVVWGASGTTEVVAQRWKGQFNENAKIAAYWNAFPELNHNEIVGFEHPRQVLDHLYLVILRDPDDHPRVKKRMAITADLVRHRVSGLKEIEAAGRGRLARMYSLIYIGDYTSVYLAFLYGVDPGPVRVIDYLKQAMAD
ncbi:MAG: bifunctional phosphoglucose/phosphomannose isomerase [Desulfotomaculales bacterium]